MAVISELLPDHFLTVAQLREMTEFPVVSARSDTQLGLYLTRAHTLLWDWLPFDDRGDPYNFATQMAVATFMIAESLALANPSRAAQAAGFSSETIGKYSYSRAPGGGSTGQGIKGDMVPDEALAILARWSKVDDASIAVATTHVFQQAAQAADNELERIFAMGDDLHLSPLSEPNGWGSSGVRG